MRTLAFSIGVLALLIAASAFAIQTGPVHGDSIGVLDTPQHASYGVDGSVRQAMTTCLKNELVRAGFSAHLVRRTLDTMRRNETKDDFLIEVAYGNADGGPVVAAGTGGYVGTTAVGAEVAVVTGSVDAEIRVYDAHTLELVDSFPLRSTVVSPALTGVSLGGYYGYISVGIPYFRNEPFRRAARDVARQAAARISGTAGENAREQRSR